jgi:hypothetical protein
MYVKSLQSYNILSIMRRPNYLSRFTFDLTYTHCLTDLSVFKELIIMQNFNKMTVLLFTPHNIRQL